MAGTLSGALDMSLQRLVFESPVSTGWGLRTSGLIIIAIALTPRGTRWKSISLGGVALALGGLLFVGHTAAHPYRGWLALLLSAHLAVVAFWFGALLPLCIVTRQAGGEAAASIGGWILEDRHLARSRHLAGGCAVDRNARGSVGRISRELWDASLGEECCVRGADGAGCAEQVALRPSVVEHARRGCRLSTRGGSGVRPDLRSTHHDGRDDHILFSRVVAGTECDSTPMGNGAPCRDHFEINGWCNASMCLSSKASSP